MDEEQTRVFAVETAAQIEVLRVALVALTAQVMTTVPPEQRDETLAEIQRATGDLPPHPGSPIPEATRLYEDIAAAAPAHAKRFVEDVRRAID